MKMKIILYRKSGCPWSAAVIGFLNELNIPYEIKNVTTNPAYGKELQAATEQCMSPTLDIDGMILPNASARRCGKGAGGKRNSHLIPPTASIVRSPDFETA
jgi:glutaredoxin